MMTKRKAGAGRKPRLNIASETSIKVKLSFDEREEWKAIAKSKGKNLSEWIRELVASA